MPPKGAKKTAVAEAPAAAAPVAETSDEPQQVIVPGANEWDAPRIYIKPKEQLTLEPYHRDHALVTGVFRAPKKKKEE